MKVKLAFYWNATCGGCEVAVVDLHEKILNVVEKAEIIFWPVALDFKYHHIEALADSEIDLCFVNGAIRNTENEEITRLLRKKSKTLVAFGSCACFGGIPGLANLYDRDEILSRVYFETQSTENPEKILPQTEFSAEEGGLTLPEFYNRVKRLKDVVECEYFLPGCPPPPLLIEKALNAIFNNNLPEKGAVISGEKTLCDECEREKAKKEIDGYFRPYEIEPDSKKCLLDQGIACLGPGTRAGCGALCVSANMGCRGCFGPPDNVEDQGAVLLSALASICNIKTEDELYKLEPLAADPAGLFYRFTLPASILKGRRDEKDNHKPYNKA
jgi:F420-non-reducing hydrogenase small subunit